MTRGNNQEKGWQRPQWVAVVTGILAVALAVAYLVLVQVLDFRGEFLPAPAEGLVVRAAAADLL